ncbi:putative Bug-like extra-cytoplasmic solute receptor, TTT family [Variovorax paradoxus B4]|uniref:Putative Bug-like extra-cytoplasmic solute receptor, TTT family n=1 Tax=Variovorax paradoxus B4 TaxID=1246301 RepID=T1XLL2_VARPD|nr:tripartite tricarboxylate transporter substrate binding protein [Variovorax paradoxus]AGU53767.1 putative Bug-like extra-cytoplasmic solute receptor, TTT family [Variovorax paradoxus B4]
MAVTLDAIGRSTRRNFLGAGLGCAALSLGASPACGATGYPARPVTLICPFVAGGPSDITGRSIAEPLGEILRQPVVVENVTGAGGLIATKRFLAAAADGHTLLVGATYLVTAPFLYKTANFNPVHDLVPLSPPVESLLIFVSSPQKDLRSLLENAKRTGDPVRAASPGAGTLSHLGVEMLRLASGAPIVHVPYRGVGPALTDVMGGHADLMLDGLSSSLPHIRGGRLRPLFVPDEQRNSLLPEVPTAAEVGFPSVKARAWNAIFARTGTPAAITDLLASEITKILARPEGRADLKKRGLEPAKLTATAFKERLAAEAAHWGSVIQTARITIE